MKINSRDFETVPCLFCKNTDTELITSKGQFGLPASVTICQNDGLVFLNPRWNKKRYEYFYKHEFDKYDRPRVLDEEPELYKYSFPKKVFERINPFITNDTKNLLDVGSGMGWVLEYLKNRVKQVGFVAAIESSEYCVNNVTDNLGFQLISRDTDSNWDSSYHCFFDLVIMRHVLEHFMDPLESLKKISRVLTDNGFVYVAVPNMMKPVGALNRFWFRTAHTYYFTECTLLKLIFNAGLEPIHIDCQTSELWGIFKKSKTYNYNMCNNYAKQKEVIDTYNKKNYWLDYKEFILEKTKMIIPYKIRLLLNKIIFNN